MFTFFGTDTTVSTSQLVPSSAFPVKDFSVVIISSVSTSVFLQVRFSAVIPVCLVDSSRHADEIPTILTFVKKQ